MESGGRQTDRAGLSEAEAGRRLLVHGPNRLPAARAKESRLRQVARNFTHLMALLLWVAGGIAFVAEMPQLGIAIWAVTLLNGAFSAWQQHRAARSVEALRGLVPHAARVLRNGVERRVPAENVVPGDVAILAEGDRVPADGAVLEGAGLRLDQALLTGESVPVAKVPGETVFAGTFVAGGHGTFEVRATGGDTEFGRVAMLTQTTAKELSPLERELQVATRTITLLAVAIGAVFLLLALALTDIGRGRAAVFALGVIVAFVPEGLLPTMTVALALGAQRMARRRALVKDLSTVETLGAATVICTDKTGTLTQNQMTVRRVWAGGEEWSVTGTGYGGGGKVNGANRHARGLLRLVEIAVCCNNTVLQPPERGRANWTVLGDPMEAALLVLARKAGFDAGAVRAALPREGEIPFDSTRLRMSTLHRDAEGRLLFVKGAVERVLACCDPATATGAAATAADWEQTGLRVLAFAWGRTEAEAGLTFAGLAGMEDPPRPEVSAAIATCRAAGVRVIMMTGDGELTARSIARQIGLAGDGEGTVITGPALDGMADTDLTATLTRPVLLARMRPEQKRRIVDILQREGHVVAMTGDGVNDAPALRRADIGVAMGASGTDVARESADLILLDDSFASIVFAIEEGRAVFANVRKFTTYVFTSNAPEAASFIAFALSGGRIPPALDVMRILAVDLGTDVLPAVALGGESPEPGLMRQPPRPRTAHLIDRAMLWRSLVWLGLPQSLAVMGAFFATYWANGHPGHWLDLPAAGPLYSQAVSAALAAVVASLIGNPFAQRSESESAFAIPLSRNPFLLWGVAAELLCLAAFLHVPALRAVLGTAPLSWLTWAGIAATIPLLVLFDEIRKRRRATGRAAGLRSTTAGRGRPAA